MVSVRPWVRVVLLSAALAVCCGYLAVAALTDQVDFGVYRAGGAPAPSSVVWRPCAGDCWGTREGVRVEWTGTVRDMLQRLCDELADTR